MGGHQDPKIAWHVLELGTGNAISSGSGPSQIVLLCCMKDLYLPNSRAAMHYLLCTEYRPHVTVNLHGYHLLDFA